MMRVSLAALVLVVVASGAAAAAPKVALTAIDGDDSGDVREAVAEALDGKDLTVIGAKETNRAIDKLKGGVSGLTEKQAKKLSTDLEVDAIVYGSLGKDGANKVLRFKLFVNGKKSKGFSVQFTNPRSKKFKDALHSKMVDKLSAVPEASDKPDKPDKPDKAKKKGDEDDDEDPNPKTKKSRKDKADKADKDDDKAAKKSKKSKTDKADKADKKVDKADQDKDDEDTDDDAPRKAKKKTAKVDDGDEDERATVTVRATGKHTANRDAVRVDVGVSASIRSLTFTATPELQADGQAPKPFKPGPVAGARVEGEIYPLAFANPRSFAAGLGVAFEFDKAISSKVQSTAEPGSVGIVNQTHYLIGGRYRIPLGSTVTAPSISIGAGYGRRTFKVKSGFTDRNALDLPDTDYKYIAPALGFRIPFTANIAFTALGEAILVSDAGPIVTSTQYGRAKVFGFDMEAGLDVVLNNRFAIRFAFEMAQIGYTFTGGGEKTNNRDMDPTTVDIGGALDRTIGGLATLAVLY